MAPGGLALGDRVLGLAGAVGATTERAQLVGHEQGLVTVAPAERQRHVADPAQLAKLIRVGAELAGARRACVARAVQAELAIRQDALVAVRPVDPERVPTN